MRCRPAPSNGSYIKTLAFYAATVVAAGLLGKPPTSSKRRSFITSARRPSMNEMHREGPSRLNVIEWRAMNPHQIHALGAALADVQQQISSLVCSKGHFKGPERDCRECVNDRARRYRARRAGR